MKRKTLIALIGLQIIIAAGIFIYIELTRSHTYYIDLQKVYQEFEFKKELEKKLEAMATISAEQLDSLQLQAEIINRSLQEYPSDKTRQEEYNLVANTYTSKSQQFDYQREKMAEEYDQQIWSQLNEYIKQYGKEKNCDFIVAGNGDGSIMYSNDSKDITEEMIRYVNAQYQGQ